LFERRCAGCRRVGPAVCRACLARFEPAPAGEPPPTLVDCVDSFSAVVVYDRLAASVILAAKNGGRRDVLRSLAELTAARVDTEVEVDAVSWVPASRARQRWRGYDQGDLLARAIARHLRVPARRLLRRSRGDAQANRGRQDRLAGPAVHLARRRVPERVLLIDDVATTGASLAACAAALRRGGACRIDAVVIAVARTSQPTRSLATNG
jgi:ComF family protein